VTVEAYAKKYDARGNKTRAEVTEITHADPAKNLGKVVHTVTTEPNGNQTRIEEQVSPDPVESDGTQRLSHKNLCNVKIISPEEVDYSGFSR